MTDHTLAAGTADDHSIKIGGCYSGGSCYTGADQDQTPEFVNSYSDPDWSIMAKGPQTKQGERTMFSIEELLTIDFDQIPSVDEQ